MLKASGVEVAIITGRTSRCVEARAKNLGIVHVYQGVENKLEAMLNLLNKLKLTRDAAAYVGDEVVDLTVMRHVGLSVSVPESPQLVRDYSSDVVILECSGLADPAEVVDAVTDLYTARLARLERIIALLHPVSAEESHSSAYVTTQAIRCADELILNKQDLYVPGHWESFRKQILTQNPYARLWETTHARIAPSALLAPRASAGPTTTTNVLFDKSPAKGCAARGCRTPRPGSRGWGGRRGRPR